MKTEPIADGQVRSPFVTLKTSFRHKPAFHILLIALFGLVVYSNTLSVPFAFDDGPSITDNPAIRDFGTFKNISKLQNTVLPQEIKTIFRSRYIGYLSFALNYKLHGLAVAGYHATNILIHITNALLVYLLILLTFKTPYFSPDGTKESEFGNSDLIAFFPALIFVCHPVQTEAVTYIVQRFASFATLFYLLSLILYVQSRLSGPGTARYGFYAFSFISAVFAMRTKEISFTLPVAIGLYEFMFFAGPVRNRILTLIPLSFTMSIIPLALSGTDGLGGGAGSLADSISRAGSKDITRWDYLFTQFNVIVTYIRLLLLPVVQNLDYDYPIYHSLFQPEVFLSLALLLSIVATGIYLLYRSRRMHGPSLIRLISFGIFWFFIALSVESSFIPIKDVIFEHRLYLPSVGFFISITALIMLIKNKLSPAMKNVERMVIPVLFLVVLVLSCTAYARNAVWQDEIRLWKDTASKSPYKARPHNNLGLAYYKNGSIDKALREYLLVVKIKPDYEGVHLNIGTVYYNQGRFEAALREYQTALRLKPGYAKAYNNIGNVYFKQEHFDEALREYRDAIRLNPDYAEAHNNIGNVLSRQGRLDEALREYRIALQYRPDFSVAHNNSGNIFFIQGRFDEALREYKMVLKLSPDYIGIFNSIGDVYYKQGRLGEALKEYQTALSLKPDFASARKKLEIVKKGMENKSTNK